MNNECDLDPCANARGCGSCKGCIAAAKVERLPAEEKRKKQLRDGLDHECDLGPYAINSRCGFCKGCLANAKNRPEEKREERLGQMRRSDNEIKELRRRINKLEKEMKYVMNQVTIHHGRC